MNHAYMRLLNLMQQDLQLDVDTKAQKLLELIAVAHERGEAMTVNQAMSHQEIASAATLHRKITQLLDAGLIVCTFQGRNRRSKYLVPSAKAQSHFEKMGQLIVEIAHS